MLGIDAWMAAGLAAVALAVTLLTDWLVARLHSQPLWPDRRAVRLAADWLARLAWVALTFAGAAIVIRYLERVVDPVPGYLLLFFLALVLSLARAMLHRRSMQASSQAWAGWRVPDSRDLLVNALVVLVALVLLYALAWLAGQRLHWPAIAVLALGALLAGLDNQSSRLGRALPFLSRPLQQKLGYRQAWRTPVVAVGLALLGLPLLALGDWQIWVALPLGFVAHLLVDLLSSPGVMLLWPASRSYYHVLAVPLSDPGGRGRRWAAAVLTGAVILLTLVLGVGKEPPPPAVIPSYEQTLERYYAQRGRTLVYASVQGTWQASGRRIAGTFEVLNAVGSSLILLDRYTGNVFSGGRTADDNLYLNNINLQIGEVIRVKPAEIQLSGEPLANVLPLLYDLQAEPGLQHIYVSGDLVLAPGMPELAVDYSQTGLRRIQEIEPGRYSLRYLTAAQIIALAELRVEMADLLVVGTYTVPASGPTVTPLPKPPSGGVRAP
jgi:hypothetical protein